MLLPSISSFIMSFPTKRKYTPTSLHELSIVQYPQAEGSSNVAFDINFLPADMIPDEELDPSYHTLSYSSDRSLFSLHKIRSSRRVSLHHQYCMNSFVRYLHSQAYEIPLVGDSAFVQPKKTCPSFLSLPTPVSAVPVSNAFAVLASPASQTDNVSCPSPQEKPPMVFKRNIPPISIKTSDPSALAKLRSVLHPDTVIHYRPDRLRLRASSTEEYKTVLDFVNDQQWEFYTFNPVVLDSTKSVLRGLPPTTSEVDIRQALQEKWIHVINVRQLWKSTKSSEGVWSRTPLSVWYRTSPTVKNQSCYTRPCGTPTFPHSSGRTQEEGYYPPMLPLSRIWPSCQLL